MDYSKLEENEIKLKMKSLSDEYDVIKTKICKDIERLQELDEEYISYQDELEKRRKEFI
jgi:hypothetical protein|nr:MAG TPA: hypothetical protein [Ackermannviridae sp.]